MKLYKISGSGMYFGPFYVKADNAPQAVAKAQYILNSGLTASKSYKIIENYIESVTKVHDE